MSTVEEEIEVFAQGLPASYDTASELDTLHALVAAHPEYGTWADHVVREVLRARLSTYRTDDRHLARAARVVRTTRVKSVTNITAAAAGTVVLPSNLYHERYCVESRRGRGVHMELGDMTADDCHKAIEIYRVQRDAANFKVAILSFFERNLSAGETVAQKYNENQIQAVFADEDAPLARARGRVPDMTTSVFAGWTERFWQHRYALTMDVFDLQGGQPVDKRIVATLIKQRLGYDDEELLAQAVGEILAETNQEATPENIASAAKQVEAKHGLNVFRCDDTGMFLGGYALKAALKEAVSVARAAGNLPERYGTTKKGVISYAAEHIGVVESKLYLMRDDKVLKEPDETAQKIVHAQTPRGKIHSLKYVEVVSTCQISATIETDTVFQDSEWAAVWLTGERQGIGAGRSGSAGRYLVTRWEKLPVKKGTPAKPNDDLAPPAPKRRTMKRT